MSITELFSTAHQAAQEAALFRGEIGPKADLLDNVCRGGGRGGKPCAAYAANAPVADGRCGGVGVRFDGLPSRDEVNACRQAAEQGKA